MLRTAIAVAIALILATDLTWSQSSPQFIAFQAAKAVATGSLTMQKSPGRGRRGGAPERVGVPHPADRTRQGDHYVLSRK